LNTHIIDTLQLGRPGIIAATALETSDGIVLFDTGPESTFENVAAGLQKVGVGPADVRHVFLSHIHFDHAGAAWRFAEYAGPVRQSVGFVPRRTRTGATIYVHPHGVAHLIDPAKLIKSATRIFGDDMQRLWGRIAPVPAERVRIVQDMEIIRVPPFEIRAIATPGHARHHHIYQWDDSVFGGDIAGVRIGGGPPIPPFVPPELHIESWHESIAKIRQINPAKLYLPHFGKVEGSIAEHLDAVDERVTRWSEWFRERMREIRGQPPARKSLRLGEPSEISDAELIAEFARYQHDDLIAGGATEDEVQGYEAADPSYMAVPAAIRYWNKYHPDGINRG
jgi:glyoxylase-like metal-dependent hydrolase (beta-lactamase superfamily II)